MPNVVLSWHGLRSMKPESERGYRLSNHTRQAISDSNKDPMTWFQVLAPLLLAAILLGLYLQVQHSRTENEKTRIQLESRSAQVQRIERAIMQISKDVSTNKKEIKALEP